MKPTLITAVLVLATAASASVLAAPADMGKYHDRHLQRMTSELQLSEEQQQQLRTVHQEHLDKMKTLHQDKQDQVKAILSDEQHGKWQTLREQRRDKMKQHMQDRKDRSEGRRGMRNAPDQ